MKRQVMQMFKRRNFFKAKYLVFVCCFQGGSFTLVAW
jgi:hypothetical protein